MIESFKLPVITPETLTGSIVSFNDEYGGLPLKSCTSLISGYQEGTGTPSPDNVRPLHAFSSGLLSATGKNLAGLFIDGKGIAYDGNIVNSAKRTSIVNMIKIEKNTDYVFSFLEGLRGSYALYNGDKFVRRYIDFNTPMIINISDGYRIRLSCYSAGDTQTITSDYAKPQLELGQQATAYEPFGNTYTFTFGQSIYQGSIDWKRGVVTGNVIVDLIKNISMERSDTVASGVYRFSTLTEISEPTPNNVVNQSLVCEVLNTITNNNTYSRVQGCAAGRTGKLTFFVDDTVTTVAQFKTLYGDYKIAYPLATPIEIPLGGINLLTQEGQNNIYCDTGNTTLEYLKVN